MKNLLTIIVLALSIQLSAQAGIGLALYQDIKLATMEDDYGNEPFTPDMRFEFYINPFGLTDKTHFELGLTFQYADLAGGDFTRYGLQGGPHFKNYSFFNLFEYDWKLLAGYGIINRGLISDGNTIGYNSAELTLEFQINLTENLAVNWKNTLMQRGDLGVFGSKEASFRPWDWKPNSYLGVTYRFKTTGKRERR